MGVSRSPRRGLAFAGLAVLLAVILGWSAHCLAQAADAGQGAAAPAHAERKILYYRNPMGLADTSPVPKKDGMGMDYIPVYQDEAGDAGTVRVGLDKVQKLGVRTEAVALRPMVRSIRAVGTIQVDERRLTVIAPKFEGWIEQLNADTTGQRVHRGESLMEVYSPGLVLAQQEYLVAARNLAALKDADAETRATARQLAESALTRLRYWDIGEDQIQRLGRRGSASRTLSITAPADGVILDKIAVRGMRFMPGEMLYKIADLSRVWVIAEVFEQDLGQIRPGQKAEVSLNAFPGRPFAGKVDFIYPTLTAETRTVKVRVELANPDGELRPALYATVVLAAPQGDGQVLAMPDSALLDTGSRQVVLVERGEGLYEPRPVRTGVRADGYVEVRDGLVAGDIVVVRANFLIDAEANLRAALGHFEHGK
ncbi:MAG: efflux RND transporter periplasmic adaptor subunit [Azospirillum sp.]|nr:efflux RND transporter periplasmic adaptor subunit [Azospirillum sp.]